MNKELETQLLTQASSILENITNTVSQAKTLAVEQLPDIAYQYISYGTVWSIVSTIFLFIVLLLTGYGTYFFAKNDNPICVLTGFSFTGLLIGFYVSLKTMFFILFAPKVWLIQNIIHLLK